MKINGLDYEGTGMDSSAPPRKTEPRRGFGNPLWDSSPPGTPIFGPMIDKTLKIDDSTPGAGGPADELRYRTWPGARDPQGRPMGPPATRSVDAAARAVEAATPIVPNKR